MESLSSSTSSSASIDSIYSDYSTIHTSQTASSLPVSPVRETVPTHFSKPPHPLFRLDPPSSHQTPATPKLSRLLPLSSVSGQLQTLEVIDLGVKMAKIVHALNKQSSFLQITCQDDWSILVTPTQVTPHLNSQALLNRHCIESLNESNLVFTHCQNVAPEFVKPNLYSPSDQPATDVYTLCSLFYQLLIAESSSQVPLDPPGIHPSSHPMSLTCSNHPPEILDKHQPRLLLAHLHETINILPIRPSRFRFDIPPELDSILLKGLSKDPIERYLNSFSLARDLEKLHHMLTITSPPTSSAAQLSLKILRPHLGLSYLRASSTPVQLRPAFRSYPGSDSTVLVRKNSHMNVGALDSLARLEISNKLYGADESSRELCRLIQQADKNSRSLHLVVRGPSGVGKTELIAQVVKPIVSQTGGLWLPIKFEMQSDAAFSIRRKLLNSLLRPLVLSLNNCSDEPYSSSSSQASTTATGNFKKLILDPLGQVLLTPYIDRDLRAAFQLQPQSADPPDNTMSPLLCKALDSAIVRIVRKCAKTFSSLMLLFDDLQWVRAPDCALLEYLLGTLPEISGCVVIFCMRPHNSLDPYHEDFGNSALRKLVAECTNVIELGPLQPESLMESLADILGPLDVSEHRIMTIERRKQLKSLAEFIRNSSATTPMFCKQFIWTLRERAILVFDWDAELWRFDSAAARGFVSNQLGTKLNSSVTIASRRGHTSPQPNTSCFHAEAVSFLRSVLEALPARLRKILVHASCLSAQGPFTIQLLYTALGEHHASERRLAALRSDVMLLVSKKILKFDTQLETDHLPLSGESCSLVHTYHESACFVHDQWNEASHLLLLDRQLRAEMYHSIAINLGATLAVNDEESEGFRNRCLRTVCYNLKLALEHGHSFVKADWELMYQTIIETSKRELRDVNPRAVINYVEFCLTRLSPSHWDSRPSEMMLLHELLTNAYHLIGEPTKVLTVARAMRARSRNALHFVKAIRAKLKSLFLVNPHKGIKLSIKTVEHFFKLKISSKYQVMCADGVFRRPTEKSTCTKTPSAVELEYQALLADIIIPVYRASVEHGKAIMWISYEFAQAVGWSSHVPLSLGGLAVFCCHENNFDAAKEYVALGESICNAEHTTPYQRLGFDYTSGQSRHFLSPSWETARREYMETAERSAILANFDIATNSLAHALITGFWSSAKLHPQIDIAVSVLSQSEKTSPASSIFAAIALAAIENLTQATQSIDDPTVLTHQYLAPDAYLHSQDFPLHELQWTSYQLILNLLFEKPTWQLYALKRGLSPIHSALMQNIICQFLFCVAICEGIRTSNEVVSEDHRFLDSTIERFAVWSCETKVDEFKVMLLILQALVSSNSSKNSIGLVVPLFDEAIELALAHSLWLFAGLACEMVCTYLESSAPKSSHIRLSLGYQVAAYQAYTAWGAVRKCEQMRTKWPHLSCSSLEGLFTFKLSLPASAHVQPAMAGAQHVRADTHHLQPRLPSQHSFERSSSDFSLNLNCPAPVSFSQKSPDLTLGDGDSASSSVQDHPSLATAQICSDTSLSKSKEFDVAALLAASHSWQTETTIEGMTVSLMKVLLQISGAEYGCIALVVDDTLRVRAAGTAHELQGDLDLSLHEARQLAPMSILRYVARTRGTATSKLLRITTLQDEFLRVRAPARMLGEPIMLNGQLAGVVYLDSHNPSAFSHADHSIISCLSTQAVIALEKTVATRVLEDKVNERTRELSNRNEELAVAMKVADDARQAEARFLMNMSHELRTPANSIIVLSELLQEAPNLNGLYQEYLNQIKSSSNDLLAIIQHVLDFSKLSSHNVLIEKLPFNLRDCMESAIQAVAAQASSKGLECWYTTPIDEDPETLIIGDEFRCKQVIMNYLSNAIRFTPRGGFVAVRAKVRPARIQQSECEEAIDGLMIEVDVQDNGIGIPKDKQEHLFKSFAQVDESTTRLYGGTGLGLAISRSLARLLGGDASVSSTPGCGSTFSFSFMAMAGDRIGRPVNVLAEPLAQLPNRQADCFVLAAPHIARRMLCENLQLSGVTTTRALAGIVELQEAISDGFRGVLVVDMLLRGPDETKYVGQLIQQRILARIVMIGNEIKSMMGGIIQKDVIETMSRDPRLVLSTRPIKMKRLFGVFSSLASEAQQSKIKTGSDGKGLHVMLAEKPLSDRLPVLVDEFPLKILAVDDNQVNRLVIKKVLERLGYMDVDLSVDGKAAVEHCEAKKYDLCLMDSEMPVQDGTSAMKEIRWKCGDQSPFIAVVTAAAMPGEQEKFMQNGFDAYIAKPVKLQEVVEVIKDASRRQKAKQEKEV